MLDFGEMLALCLFSLLISALAVWQATVILHEGSIFEPLRRWISDNAWSSGLFHKLEELFDCFLCLSTQVSLWTVGVLVFILNPTPLMETWWLGLIGGEAPRWFGSLFRPLGSFGIALAVARAARIMLEVHGAMIERIRREKYKNAIGNTIPTPSTKGWSIPSVEEITHMIENVVGETGLSGCRYFKRKKQHALLEREAKRWARNTSEANAGVIALGLQDAFDETYPAYGCI